MTNVGFNNFAHALGMDSAVEDAVGINSHGRSKLALIQAAGLVRSHQFQAALGQFDLEQTLQFTLSGGVAAPAGVARFALIHANEDVFFEFWHGLRRVYQDTGPRTQAQMMRRRAPAL